VYSSSKIKCPCTVVDLVLKTVEILQFSVVTSEHAILFSKLNPLVKTIMYYCHRVTLIVSLIIFVSFSDLARLCSCLGVQTVIFLEQAFIKS
jgi:hypothetical protein